MKSFNRPGIGRRRSAAVSVLTTVLTLVSCGVTESESAAATEKPSRPNILLVVADDLGMLDIGAFGSEIRTPTIDRLANAGLKFTNFHTSAVCSPTRAMLLSGVDTHAAGLGNMVEHMAPNQQGKDGYEGHLSRNVVSVATLLQDAGYHTYMAGKWHLGKMDEDLPYRRGFDESFVLLQGGASYFDDMMGLVSVVPKALYRRNGETVTGLPEDFYASEDYADFIIDHIKADRGDNKPFFAYLAFTAPHWPLQVPDAYLDLYKGRYDKGYDDLHAERVTAAGRLGVLPEKVVSAARPAHVKPWAELDPVQQKTQARTMEIYAAVVERMDYHLGRVLDYLDETDQLNNTVVVFMSDNGADGSDRSKLPGNDTWLQEAWDTSYENMGKKGSYVYPGAAWARASVGPFRMYKEFLSEGGIRSPMIISYPDVANKGSRVSDFITVKDITPTLLDFAGTRHPGTEYKGRTVKPLEGVSLQPFIAGNVKQGPHDKEYMMGYELFGQKAIIKGDWKLLWLTSKPKWLVKPANADQWRLYNLADDPAEINDLSAQQPEKLAEMLRHWKTYSEQHGVILPEWK